MFNKILVANRGEIAVRAIRACKLMGIKTVAVYSEADTEALHVLEADESYKVGPSPVALSYLNMDEIIATAIKCGAEAIHPGYGLLSENPDFADKCSKQGIVFIGPPTEAISSMGIKTTAREIMKAAGVPVTPGSDPLESEEQALQEALRIGYPVIVKASAGGGGIGMQVVESPENLQKAFETCQARAKSSFGNSTVYLEKYFGKARHIEIQVFADKFGNVVHLGERECSIQRRHQKVVEESPSPVVNSQMRSQMGNDAVKAAQAIGYVGAGTVEFLVDENLNYYFLEMNTRLQVEHPVTEMVTGTDLLIEQIKVAAGYKLSWTQNDIDMNGHAIECRLYAEDSCTFRPSTGVITKLVFPELDLEDGEFVRFDSGIREGYKVSAYYDPMLIKIIVKAPTRQRSLELMYEVLGKTQVEGVKTNTALLQSIVSHPKFMAGHFSTSFIEKEM
ncbi:MAG: accC [Firmicutes bacterium]|nr:accC [Bacillota bacterium]